MDSNIRPPDAQIMSRLIDTVAVAPSAPQMPPQMTAEVELDTAIEESRRMAEEIEYMTALEQIAEFEWANKQEQRRKNLAPLREKLARLHALGDTKVCAAYDELELSFETYILNDAKIAPTALCEAALRGIRLTFAERELITAVFAPCAEPSVRTCSNTHR